MDRIIRLMQVAGAVVLLVAVVAGYSFVRGLSAQEESDDCESDPYCSVGTKGSLDDPDSDDPLDHEPCATPNCDSVNQWCCLDPIIVR